MNFVGRFYGAFNFAFIVSFDRDIYSSIWGGIAAFGVIKSSKIWFDLEYPATRLKRSDAENVAG